MFVLLVMLIVNSNVNLVVFLVFELSVKPIVNDFMPFFLSLYLRCFNLDGKVFHTSY